MCSHWECILYMFICGEPRWGGCLGFGEILSENKHDDKLNEHRTHFFPACPVVYGGNTWKIIWNCNTEAFFIINCFYQ